LLYFETVAIVIFLILEELLQDNVLIFLQNTSFAVDEGGKETKILCGEVSAPHAGSLSIEAFDQIIDFLLSDCRLDGFGVVLKYPHKALLNVLSVDVFRVLEEEVDPPRQVELVLLVTHHDFLQQLVNALENLLDSDPLGAVSRCLGVLLNEDKGNEEVVDDLYKQFSSARFNKNLLDERIGGVSR